MESEEDAKDTILDLKLKRRLFRSQLVKARLKTETLVRSYFPVQSAGMAPGAMFAPSSGGMSFSMYPPSMPGFPLGAPFIPGGMVAAASSASALGYSQKPNNVENLTASPVHGDEEENENSKAGKGNKSAAASTNKKVFIFSFFRPDAHVFSVRIS